MIGSRLYRLFLRGDALIFVLIFPISLFVAGFGHELLQLWVGAEFAFHAAPVLRWLAIMIVVCGFSEMPVLLIQAGYRPDCTAKLRMAEVPLTLLLVVLMARWNGLEGVAVATVIRVSVDAITVSLLAHYLFPSIVPLWNRTIWMLLGAGVVFLAGEQFGDPKVRSLVLLAAAGMFELAIWKLFLQSQDREAVVRVAHSAAQRALYTFRARPAL